MLIQRVEDSLNEKMDDLNIDNDIRSLIPFSKMLNMDISIDKLLNYLEKDKKILVVGDYDVDGIVATTIFKQFFTDHPELPSELSFFIPDRIKHGYGISPLIMDMAKEQNVDLVITVDNGISAVPAIERAKELGIDIIITDHHTVPTIKPDLDTMVNPKLDNNLSFQDISGATVAWSFLFALNQKLKTQLNMAKYLDLVALTVLSDVMPLQNVNRTILSYGMNKIKHNSREVYNKVFSQDQRNHITSSDISFNLVPKLNATGRLNNANKGVKLFLENNVDSILSEINYINEDRKMKTDIMLKLILPLAEKEVKAGKKIIVVHHPELHEGIIGILASRIVEKFQLPTIVLTSHDGVFKGSARSIGDIHLYNLLNQHSELMLGFGGHKGAAGLSITKENLSLFKRRLNSSMKKDYSDEDYISNVYSFDIDNLTQLNMELAKKLHSYEPFGEQFEKPKFLIKNAMITNIIKNKENKHYLCEITDSFGNTQSTWFFHFSDDMKALLNQEMNILVDVGINFWNGNQNLSLISKIYI